MWRVTLRSGLNIEREMKQWDMILIDRGIWITADRG
jgi:hypothetical protein